MTLTVIAYRKMVPFERKMELEEQLKEAGNNLLNPQSSVDDSLMLLDVNEPHFILFLCCMTCLL